MVDQDFGVDPELLKQQIFFGDAGPRQFAHRVNPVLVQPLGDARPDLPEVGEGLVVPEQVAEGLLVQLGNPDAFGVGWDVLCDDVHRQLAEVEVAADAGRGGDAGGVVDIPDDGFGQLPGGQMVMLEISRYVHKNLVD